MSYRRVRYIRGNRFVEFPDQKASGVGAASTMIAADAMVAVFLESRSPPCESEKRLGGISGPGKRSLLAVI